MKYTVVWRPNAERSLTNIWTYADDRQDVTNAANDIDALLRSSPLAVGESRAGNCRLLLMFPLGVFYDVSDEDRIVAVWAIWRIQKVS